MNKRIRNTKGAINEYLGFIFFMAVVLGILLPFIVELLAFTGQAQEVDRITKIAAKRACSLMADSNIGIAADLKQSGLGVATGVDIMQPIVNQVFRNETSHPEKYLENTQDGNNIELRLFDFLGQEIDIKSDANKIEIEDPNGNKDKLLMVGTNSEAALCPAGGGGDWKYCLQEGSDDAAKNALAKTGMKANSDLVQRMQKLQAGRCAPGDKNCRNDFRGRLDRCTVCATKTRESIFRKTLFGPVLACENSRSRFRVFPCAIHACATEKFVQLSGKRGYNVAYQDKSRLGEQFNAKEIHPNSKLNGKNSLLQEETKVQDSHTKEDEDKGTVQFYENMDSQFGGR